MTNAIDPKTMTTTDYPAFVNQMVAYMGQGWRPIPETPLTIENPSQQLEVSWSTVNKKYVAFAHKGNRQSWRGTASTPQAAVKIALDKRAKE